MARTSACLLLGAGLLCLCIGQALAQQQDFAAAAKALGLPSTNVADYGIGNTFAGVVLSPPDSSAFNTLMSNSLLGYYHLPGVTPPPASATKGGTDALADGVYPTDFKDKNATVTVTSDDNTWYFYGLADPLVSAKKTDCVRFGAQGTVCKLSAALVRPMFTVYQAIQQNPDLSMMLDLIDSNAQLKNDVYNNFDFAGTIFAPTNDAFNKYMTSINQDFTTWKTTADGYAVAWSAFWPPMVTGPNKGKPFTPDTMNQETRGGPWQTIYYTNSTGGHWAEKINYFQALENPLPQDRKGALAIVNPLTPASVTPPGGTKQVTKCWLGILDAVPVVGQWQSSDFIGPSTGTTNSPAPSAAAIAAPKWAFAGLLSVAAMLASSLLM